MKAHFCCNANSTAAGTRVRRSAIGGSVMLEASIVLPVLFTIVALAFDFSSWLYTRSLVIDAASAAARRAAVVVADYLDTGNAGAHTTLCPDGVTPGCFTCEAAANWAQHIAEGVISQRLGSPNGTQASVQFIATAGQPTLMVRIERPYQCLFCVGFLARPVVSESTVLIEDRQLGLCEGIVASEHACDPANEEACR